MITIYGSLLVGFGLVMSPGIKIQLDDKIYVYRYTIGKSVLDYPDINRVIYSTYYFRIRFVAPHVTFMMQSLPFQNKRFIKELQKHGVLCEKYDKKTHSPDRSSLKFWFSE